MLTVLLCHEGFSIATIKLDGSIGNFTVDRETGKGLPLLVHAYLPEDAALKYMWSPSNINNTNKFLEDIPEDAHFMFISYGSEPLPDITQHLNLAMQVLFCVLPQGPSLMALIDPKEIFLSFLIF